MKYSVADVQVCLQAMSLVTKQEESKPLRAWHKFSTLQETEVHHRIERNVEGFRQNRHLLYRVKGGET